MSSGAPVISLPAEVRFSDVTGLVTGTAHCALKDAALTIDNKTLTTIKNFAQYGEWEMRTGKKTTLELQLEAPSLEIEALLTGADLITTRSYEGYFGEIVGPAIAGVFPALTNIPLLEGSEVVRKCSDPEGKDITGLLDFTAGAPAVTSYSIVNATGVMTTDGAYILYAIANYAKYDAAAGETLITDDTADLPLQDVVIIAKAWEPTLQKKGSAVFVFEACEIIQEPGQGITDSANTVTVRFNVGGPMKKSIHLV